MLDRKQIVELLGLITEGAVLTLGVEMTPSGQAESFAAGLRAHGFVGYLRTNERGTEFVVTGRV